MRVTKLWLALAVLGLAGSVDAAAVQATLIVQPLQPAVGQTVVVQWYVTDATTVTLDGLVMNPSGQTTWVAGTTPWTFTLRASAPGTAITIAQDAVPVGAPPAPPPPTPAPTPVPAPVPTPAPGMSPIGTTIPPAASITDSAGAVWTVKPPNVLRNGVDMKAIYLAPDHIYLSTLGRICEYDNTHGSACYDSGSQSWIGTTN